MDNRTLIESLRLTDEDRETLFEMEKEATDINACMDMVFKAMEESAKMEGFKEAGFLTKLTLIARWAYLYGYGAGLYQVQAAQTLELEELLETEAPARKEA